MNGFLLTVSLVWVLIYGIRSCASSSSYQSLLPVSAPSRTSSKFRLTRGNGARLEFSVRNLHLELRTSAFNSAHDAWISFWRSSDDEKWGKRGIKIALRAFYNIGVVCGIAGFLVGIGVLAYGCKAFWIDALLRSDTENNSFTKRSLDAPPVATQQSGHVIDFIIPGVTVPWSHFPLILLALFVSQCFHEAGHAIAGAMEELSLHSVGASLTLILPSAFVVFASSMESLTPVGRLRVISSGAWHNLVLWVLLYFASFQNFSSVWTYLGWKDVSNSGVVVLEVDESSPLVYHLSPGNIITSLDDTPLGSSQPIAERPWTQYLLGPHLPSQEGWCIDADAFYEQTASCCEPNGAGRIAHPPAVQLSCFVPTGNGNQGHCVDPVPILVPLHRQRCFSASDCNENAKPSESTNGKECIRPDVIAQLLRIGVSPPLWEADEERIANRSELTTVLWSGPSDEVWEQVKIGTLAPRYRFLPVWLPYTTLIFFSYLSTLSLSLYVFNLFALPFLDGSHFLSALLDCLGNSREQVPQSLLGEYDVELGGRHDDYVPSHTGRAVTPSLVHRIHVYLQALNVWAWSWRRRIRRRKAAVERAVKYVTIVLMCFTGIGAVWHS